MKLKSNIAVSETGFVFDPNSGDSFTLNTIGKEIMKLSQSGKSKAEIFKAILDKYEVDEFTFERNYEDFLGMLNHFNLIENE